MPIDAYEQKMRELAKSIEEVDKKTNKTEKFPNLAKFEQRLPGNESFLASHIDRKFEELRKYIDMKFEVLEIKIRRHG